MKRKHRRRSRESKLPRGEKPASLLRLILMAVAIGTVMIVVNPPDIDLSTKKHDETPPSPGVKPYPLKVCIVSADRLDAMGKPHVLEHAGQQVKFCCRSCVKEFKAAPAKFLAKLTELEVRQRNAPPVHPIQST